MSWRWEVTHDHWKCNHVDINFDYMFELKMSTNTRAQVQTSYVIGLFKEPIIGSLKSKTAKMRHLENRYDVIFFWRGWSNLDKISETGAECHIDCGDVVEILTRCRIPIWRTFGRIQWHVIPEPPATLHGAATWRIQCHDSGATCHTAGCCHLVNSLSRFESHMPHCRMQSPGEINVMIVPHCRV